MRSLPHSVHSAAGVPLKGSCSIFCIFHALHIIFPKLKHAQTTENLFYVLLITRWQDEWANLSACCCWKGHPISFSLAIPGTPSVRQNVSGKGTIKSSPCSIERWAFKKCIWILPQESGTSRTEKYWSYRRNREKIAGKPWVWKTFSEPGVQWKLPVQLWSKKG